MEKIRDPNLKNKSSGLSGILGSSGAISPYFNANGSLPDLKQAKRESKCRSYFFLSQSYSPKLFL